jgi:spore maturation protein CgeB
MFRRKRRRPIRLIVAVPPRHFFGGNDRANAEELLDSLRELYPSLFIFDTMTLFSNDRPRIERLIEAAKDFRADVGLALPNASYAMVLKPLPPQANSQKTWIDRLQDRFAPRPLPENIFTDILGLPTILLWDHVITQPAYLVLGDLPLSRRQGEFGAVAKLQKALSNNRFRHFIPDTGHIEAVSDLGILTSRHVRPYIVPAHTSFLAQTPEETPARSDSILFAGNLYSSATKTFDADERPLVAQIAQSMTDRKKSNWMLPGWTLLRAAMNEHESAVPELSPDNSFFWSLANKLMAGHLSSAFRREVLESCPMPVDYYGGFADPAHAKEYPAGSQIVHRGSVPLSELRHLYRQYKLSIDVTHSPFIRGSNAKILDCFAAGGCMMVDWREDLANAVGDVANHFMYRDRGELAARSDALLSNEKLRQEVMQEMRQIIREKLTFNRLLTSIVEETLA